MMLRAPFPYAGGKRLVATRVWEALGSPRVYIEPFFGSGAVLLARPDEPGIETVNDRDGLLCNVWRAMQLRPEETAEHADYPVSELDLFARHQWLVNHSQNISESLRSAPPGIFERTIATARCQPRYASMPIYPIASLPRPLRAATVHHEGALIHVDWDSWEPDERSALELHLVLSDDGIVGAARRSLPLEDPLVGTFRRALVRCAGLLGISAPNVLQNNSGNASSDGKIIRVNPQWLRKAMADHCTNSLCDADILYAIATHEVTHHFFGDAFNADGTCHINHRFELRADAVAGWVLAKLGLTGDGIKRAYIEYSNHPSCSHPGWQARHQALDDGRAFAFAQLPASSVAQLYS